jgi:signal peptidase II
MKARLGLFIIVLLVMLALDQASKVWVRSELAPAEPDRLTHRIKYRSGVDPWCQLSLRQVRVVDGYFDLCYSENTGVAFGMGKNVPRWVWIGVGVLALGLIMAFLRQTKDGQRSLVIALALVGGGALGNIIDRAIFGHVTDFIVWRWHEHTWPTFNVADASLVAGVLLMLIKMEKRPAPEAAPKDGESAPRRKSRGR